MEHNIGGYNIHFPLRDTILPLRTAERTAKVQAVIEAQALAIMTDELDLEERTAFLINTLTSLPPNGLPEAFVSLPDHFIPFRKISLITSIGSKNERSLWEALRMCAVYTDAEDDPGIQMRSRALVYTNPANEGLQLRLMEMTYSEYARTTDAKLLVAYPIHLSPFDMRQFQPPQPANGKVDTIPLNILNRNNLLEFIQS